jgi:hypothetical protein
MTTSIRGQSIDSATLAPMCYSAKILVNFRAYQRFGGTLDMRTFAELAGWAAEVGT